MSLVQRIYKWNKDRGHTTFDSYFEYDMLAEEVGEAYDAIAENDIVEVFDAIADIDFVFNGTTYKFGTKTEPNSYLSITAMEEIQEYVKYHLNHIIPIAREMLQEKCVAKIDQLAFSNLLNDILEIVCDANDMKPLVKTSKKVEKGSAWVNPDTKIKAKLDFFIKELS